MEVIAILPRATMAKVCKQYGHWIEAVMEAGGDFFIEIDFIMYQCTQSVNLA